jgi:hypothetical protein
MQAHVHHVLAAHEEAGGNREELRPVKMTCDRLFESTTAANEHTIQIERRIHAELAHIDGVQRLRPVREVELQAVPPGAALPGARRVPVVGQAQRSPMRGIGRRCGGRIEHKLGGCELEHCVGGVARQRVQNAPYQQEEHGQAADTTRRKPRGASASVTG